LTNLNINRELSKLLIEFNCRLRQFGINAF